MATQGRIKCYIKTGLLIGFLIFTYFFYEYTEIAGKSVFYVPDFKSVSPCDPIPNSNKSRCDKNHYNGWGYE